VVFEVAVAAIPLNVLLVLVLATGSTTLFPGLFVVIVVGFVYYFVRTNYYTQSQRRCSDKE